MSPPDVARSKRLVLSADGPFADVNARKLTEVVAKLKDGYGRSCSARKRKPIHATLRYRHSQ